MIKIHLSMNKKVRLTCAPCHKQVTVPVSKVQLYVCIEDDWHTVVFTCSSCKCKRSIEASKELAAKLMSQGVVLRPWSVQRHFSPAVTAVGAFYKPRAVTSTWLRFDEVDVAHLIHDMNTCDWFTRLAAYKPHKS